MISERYRALNIALYKQHETWGAGGWRHQDVVRNLIKQYQCKSVLDFGCGQGTLGNVIMGRDKIHAPLNIEWCDYEPARADKRSLPTTADLIVSTHSLEHVEPHLLPATLDCLEAICVKAYYIAVPHKLSGAILPDGTNAHRITESPDWWQATLSRLGRHIYRLPKTHTLKGEIRDETRYVIEV